MAKPLPDGRGPVTVMLPNTAGLGDIQEGTFVDGKWVVVRQLGGDDTGQGKMLSLRPNTVLRVTVYRYE